MEFFEFIDDRSFKIDLKDFRKRFSHELKYLNKYFELNNKMLIERSKELDAYLKDDIYKHPEQEGAFRDFYQIDYIKIPCYFYNSAIVSLYSLLENNINSLCEIIQVRTNFVIELRDLAGFNIIDKGRRFLIKIANIDFEKNDKEWIRIKDFQKLRNLIVHNNAQMKNREQYHNLIAKFEGINTYSTAKDFYITDISLVYKFLELIEKFIVNISDQIEDRKFKKFKVALELKKKDADNKLPF
ncbi:MAG: hypothetical protein PHH10_09010 [Dysgonamonadaceae bacterium]|nr:hypothetical protein [Bacteroidales bacterium]MDD4606428.1 hypothetical protein [Dysgonamonadaceae bacterium]